MPSSVRKYVYDGWNLIGEYEDSNGFKLIAQYVWGIDLSGALQDSGGVGGLLRILYYGASGQIVLMPIYNGNGDVYGLVDKSTGSIRAAYEYSAFGETLRSTGDLAGANPFRYSTKFNDTQTGLLYYGFRYYDPRLGRFVGRDPIGEKGGYNLYTFCMNSPVNGYDVLGQEYRQTFTYNTSSPGAAVSGGTFSVNGLPFTFSVQEHGVSPGLTPSRFNSTTYKYTLANGKDVFIYLDNIVVQMSRTAQHIGGNRVLFDAGWGKLYYQYDPKINGFRLIEVVITDSSSRLTGPASPSTPTTTVIPSDASLGSNAGMDLPRAQSIATTTFNKKQQRVAAMKDQFGAMPDVLKTILCDTFLNKSKANAIYGVQQSKDGFDFYREYGLKFATYANGVPAQSNSGKGPLISWTKKNAPVLDDFTPYQGPPLYVAVPGRPMPMFYVRTPDLAQGVDNAPMTFHYDFHTHPDVPGGNVGLSGQDLQSLNGPLKPLWSGVPAAGIPQFGGVFDGARNVFYGIVSGAQTEISFADLRALLNCP